jgi:hypothetical protein
MSSGNARAPSQRWTATEAGENCPRECSRAGIAKQYGCQRNINLLIKKSTSSE